MREFFVSAPLSARRARRENSNRISNHLMCGFLSHGLRAALKVKKLLALGGFLALQSIAGSAQTGMPISFEFVAENIPLGDISRPENIVYEAVRSGEFSSVQILSSWAKQTSTGGWEKKSTIFELRPVDDFETCSKAQEPIFGRFENFTRTETSGPLLFQPPRYDHELLTGKCVLGIPINEATAEIKLSVDAFHLVLETRGEPREILRSKNVSDFWLAFELERPAVYDLWSFDGNSRRPDSVSDEDLVRAISTGDQMQRAALNVLTNRMSSNFVRDSAGTLVREVTRLHAVSEPAVSALLDSKILLDPDERWKAIRALIAIGPTEQSNEVMEQLYSALELPVVDNRGPSEASWQESVENTLGAELFSKPYGKPAYEDSRFLSLGLELARSLGQTEATNLVERYDNPIRTMLTNDLIVDPIIVEVVAMSSYRDEVVFDLLERIETDPKTPPPIQSRIEFLLSNGSPLSPALLSLVQTRCSRPSSLVPQGDLNRSRAFCRGIVANLGP